MGLRGALVAVERALPALKIILPAAAAAFWLWERTHKQRPVELEVEEVRELS
jgi:hypothetical protein